jgi:hypothetical protein
VTSPSPSTVRLRWGASTLSRGSRGCMAPAGSPRVPSGSPRRSATRGAISSQGTSCWDRIFAAL